MTAKRRSRAVSVRLPLGLYHELEDERERSDLTLSELIVRILRSHSKRNAGDAGPRMRALSERVSKLERGLLFLIARDIDGSGPMPPGEDAVARALEILGAARD